MIAFHRQGLSLQQRGTKMAALYCYMASGNSGRSSGSGELVDKLRQLEVQERE